MCSQPLHEEEEEEELLRLGEEVDSIAQRIVEYRTTLPRQLNSTLSSILESQRPVLPTHLALQRPGPDDPTPFGARPTKGLLRIDGSETMHLAITGETEEAVKIQLLKEKIAANAYTMGNFFQNYPLTS